MISLKSTKEPVILLANYAQDNMPTRLQNVIDTPHELFEAIRNMGNDDMGVSESN